MYPTMEVRWFYQGDLPEAIRSWFHSGAIAPSAPQSREDWYLSLPQTDDLGIKLRQGKIEVKKCMGDRGMRSLAHQAEGWVEQWVKWSFDIDADQDFPNILLPVNAWVVVQKTRQQMQYRVTAAGEVEAIDLDWAIEQGCTLELAELSIWHQPWWSLSFEAFGAIDMLEQTLERVTRQVLSTFCESELQAMYSCGYPAWLSERLSQVQCIK
jgi:hypothetical protein